MVVVILVSAFPVLGDYITYRNNEYQLLSDPQVTQLQSGLRKAVCRYTTANVCIEKIFYFELKS